MGYLAVLLTGAITILLTVLIALISIALSFTPTIIAFMRDHHYKMVILVLNITGIGYIPALIWSVWPDSSSRRARQRHRYPDEYDDRNQKQSIDYDDDFSLAEQQWENVKKKAFARHERSEDEESDF